MGYILIFSINLFFIINTLWISIYQNKDEEKKARQIFMQQFFETLFFDFFIKEVIFLTVKAYLYFLIIENDGQPCWKRYLMIVMAVAKI